jgi:hypothetical protein
MAPSQPMKLQRVWNVAAIAARGWRTPRMTHLMKLICRSYTGAANVSPGRACALRVLQRGLLPVRIDHRVH